MLTQILNVILFFAVLSLFWKINNREVEHLGEISSLKLQLLEKERQIWNLEHKFSNLKNQDKDVEV